MKFRSTRRQTPSLSFSQALEQSLAPDGGLFVPESFPNLSELGQTVAASAADILAPFLEGDALLPRLSEITRQAFDFKMPLRSWAPAGPTVLELFHGPTAAFKDVGARFLAGCVRELTLSEGRKRTVLVATSGDTGGAVAAAFDQQPGVRVFILYPKGKISARQEKQLTTWGDSVHALAVEGDFDDCQRLVKEAFASPELRTAHGLLAANSISIGRILPQMVYYALSSLQYLKEHGKPPGFIIPTGNLGNAVAAFWARECGFPIRELVLATNSNRAVVNYFTTGVWQPLPTHATLASAMDVGNPSNAERLFDLFSHAQGLRSGAQAVSVSDDEIRQAIRLTQERWGEAICPHTAAALHASGTLQSPDWILVATAHAAKFEGLVEPLIGRAVPLPPALAAILIKESRVKPISANLSELALALT